MNNRKKIVSILSIPAIALVFSGCVPEETQNQLDETCNEDQAVVTTTYLKGGSGGGGGGGRGGGGGGAARGSQGGGGSGAKGSNSSKPPSGKAHGSYNKSSGYYAPYVAGDGSYGFWDDTDTWVECEDDSDTKKKKAKRR